MYRWSAVICGSAAFSAYLFGMHRPVYPTAAPSQTADVCDKVLPSIFRVLAFQNGVQIGIGTGFFIKQNGTALTAQHVISGPGHQLYAQLEDGTTYEIEIMNQHNLTDIAMVRLKGLTRSVPIELGNSDQVRRGEQVIHVGNTQNSEISDIEIGYINKIRDEKSEAALAQIRGDVAAVDSGLTFMKTTGSVRPGFSGGPVLNMDGQAICLISRLEAQADQLGYHRECACIPSNLVKAVIKQMEVSGTVRKPYVGMSFTEHGPGGLAVVRVQPRSPAERSGIQIGDIITHINGTAVSKPQDFYELLGYEMGRVMNLKVIRGKQNIEIVIAT